MAHTCQGGRKTYWVWSSIRYKRGQYPRALKYNLIWRGCEYDKKVIELSTTKHCFNGITLSLRLDVARSDRVFPFHTLSNYVVIGKAS